MATLRQTGVRWLYCSRDVHCCTCQASLNAASCLCLGEARRPHPTTACVHSANCVKPKVHCFIQCLSRFSIDGLGERKCVVAPDTERNVHAARTSARYVTCRGTSAPAKANPPWTSVPWHLLLVDCRPAGLLSALATKLGQAHLQHAACSVQHVI